MIKEAIIKHISIYTNTLDNVIENVLDHFVSAIKKKRESLEKIEEEIHTIDSSNSKTCEKLKTHIVVIQRTNIKMDLGHIDDPQ